MEIFEERAGMGCLPGHKAGSHKADCDEKQGGNRRQPKMLFLSTEDDQASRCKVCTEGSHQKMTM